MKNKTVPLFLIPLTVMIILALSIPASALTQGQIPNIVTRVSNALQNTGIRYRMETMGKSVFYFLALIQFVWNMYLIAIDGRMEIQSIVMSVLRQCIYISLFLVVVDNGWDFLEGLGSWIADAGSSISGVTKVEKIFTLGLDIAGQTISAAIDASSFLTEFWASAGGIIVSVFSSLIILIAFTFAGISALVASCKIYLVASIGVFCLGFGGNSYTKDIATNALRASLACGTELMVIYILIGLADAIFSSFVADARALAPKDIISFSLQTVAASLVFAALVQTIPGYMAGLFFGAGSGGSGGSAAMGTASTAMGAAMSGAYLAAKAGKIGGKMYSGYSKAWNEARTIAESPSRYIRSSSWDGNGNGEGENHPNYVDPK